MDTRTQDVLDRPDHSEACEIVQVLVRELARDERLFVILRYSEELEYAEIAKVMRCSEERVRTELVAIEGRIRELMAPRIEERPLSAP